MRVTRRLAHARGGSFQVNRGNQAGKAMAVGQATSPAARVTTPSGQVVASPKAAAWSSAAGRALT